MEEPLIRPYRAQDRDSIRGLAWNTAFMGEPAEKFFADKEILSGFLTECFTDYEPESCFVAEMNNKVVGYLTGARDKSVIEEVFVKKVLPRLLWRALMRGAFFKAKNLKFIINCLISGFKEEYKMPDFSKDYPATLHINVERSCRGLRIGSLLISKFLDYLSEKRISGVCLATMSSEAAKFFEKNDFVLLHKGKRSYFRYILQRDVPIFIYGRRLVS